MTNLKQTQDFLQADIDRVRAYLRSDEDVVEKFGEHEVAPRLQQLVTAFGFSEFERDIIVLCAAIIVVAEVADECQGSIHRPPYPSLGLALNSLPEAHWSALLPGGPLRAWRIIEIVDESDLLNSRLILDERILHHLLGLDPLDKRLMPYFKPLLPTPWLPPSLMAVGESIQTLLRKNNAPVVLFAGHHFQDQVAVAALVCHQLQVGLFQFNAKELPEETYQRDLLVRLWRRENRLLKRGLMVTDTTAHSHQLAVLIEQLNPVFLSEAAAIEGHALKRSIKKVDIPRLEYSEQAMTLRNILPERECAQLHEIHQRVAGHFSLGFHDILDVAQECQLRKQAGCSAEEAFWQSCRELCRPRLSTLAEEIQQHGEWDDLVLPETEKQVLHTIAVHLKHAYQVYVHGGFKQKSSRGFGINALFYGESGTGKTFAAEILAKQLQLSLYRIDLSAVVSKYIGETEKNLKTIFDAAESGGAILLFDEADALFGKRSEVRDSHDRYANIEVGYLLQRMESYRGLAILTTNMKNALDKAFLRRIRFMVEFSFPAPKQRSEIWRRAFPSETETRGLDWNRLAKLNVSGGNIRNIALNAAFLAVDTNQAVNMEHIYTAARGEYAKLEKLLTATEMGH